MHLVSLAVEWKKAGGGNKNKGEGPANCREGAQEVVITFLLAIVTIIARPVLAGF